MKVLMQSRSNLFTAPGGDTIQILKTAEALRKKGCQVDISTELEPDVSAYDLVHPFNLMRPQEVYLQVLNTKRSGKKVVLSTIYGPYTEYDKKGRNGICGMVANFLKHEQLEYAKAIVRVVRNHELNKGTWFFLLHGYRTLQSKIVDMTDIFLPNSKSEMKRVFEDFPESKKKQHLVVPNAVDTELFNSDVVKLSPEVEEYKGCVLCVARIERRKSQLNLVRAMKGLPLPLVLIGQPAPNHRAYFEQIKKEAGPNVYILGQIEHDLLPQFYKVARVHALISWMETPGLSSLEAGAMECNLVITEKGDTRDYFGNYALYCEPDAVYSIREAIIKAYETPVDPRLREHILLNFTWERAAEATLECYELALVS